MLSRKGSIISFSFWTFLLTNNFILIFFTLTKHVPLIGRRHSPSPARRTPEPNLEKDEGISDDLEDPAELRLQLELNEQVRKYF